MEWISDVSQGDWVRQALEGQDWGSLRCYVPGGFEAYVRVFPPLEREIGPPEDPRTEQSTWRAVAAELGVPWRNDIRTDELLGLAEGAVDTGQSAAPGEALASADPAAEEPGQTQEMPHDEASAALQQMLSAMAGEPTGKARRWWSKADSRLSDDVVEQLAIEAEQRSRRWHPGVDGVLPESTLRLLAKALAQHTATPGDGVAAVWEGWGDLNGGSAVLGAHFPGGSGPTAWLGRAMLRVQLRFSRGPGSHPVQPILSKEVLAGPRLEVPERAYFLFTAGAEAFTDGSWREAAPWRSPIDPDYTYLPSILWPADRAWVLVVEIDEDTAYIGGSRALADALLNSPNLETAEVDLSGEATVPQHHN